MKCKVTLRKDQPLGKRRLEGKGLGIFEKGKMRTVELDGEAHVRSMKNKGFKVELVKPGDVAAEPREKE